MPDVFHFGAGPGEQEAAHFSGKDAAVDQRRHHGPGQFADFVVGHPAAAIIGAGSRAFWTREWTAVNGVAPVAWYGGFGELLTDRGGGAGVSLAHATRVAWLAETCPNLASQNVNESSEMRICVFGAGSVGGYLAGYLSRGGADVSVVARGAHLAAIRANGLTVETPDETLTVRLPASDKPDDLGRQDVVLVTVKAPSLPDVAATIAPLLGPDTAVAFVMNGIPWWYFHAHGGASDGRQLPLLDPSGALWRVAGPERAIGAVFWPACSVPAPGVIRLLTGAGSGTVFGEPSNAVTPRLLALESVFQAAGLPVTLTEDIRALIWRKLAFNLSAGPLCVLTETPVMDTHTEAALIHCSGQVLREAIAIAAAMGITLKMDIPAIAETNKALAHRPSILQDLTSGRKLEIEALYGVPLEMARTAGVPTPMLDILVGLIKVKARARGLYRTP